MDQRRDIDRDPEFLDPEERPEGADAVVVTETRLYEVDDAESRNLALGGSEDFAHEKHRERSPTDIERDIAHTRANMSETIQEIEERLSPHHLKEQVKDTVHDTIDSVQERFSPSRLTRTIEHKARGAGYDMMEAIKENPLPALIAGFGIAWLIRNAAEQGRDHDHEREYYGRGYGASYRRTYGTQQRGYYGPYGGERAYRGSYEPEYYESDRGARRYSGEDWRSRMSDVGEDLKHRAEEKADDLQHRAADTLHSAQDKAGHAAREAREGVEHAAHQVQYGARRATNWLDDLMHENPITTGLVALGVGAAVGFALPGTEREDEWMGSVRDEFIHTAKEKAEDVVDKAKTVAEKTGDEIKESAKEVGEVAKDEAKKQADSGTSSTSEGSKVGAPTAQGGSSGPISTGAGYGKPESREGSITGSSTGTPGSRRTDF